VPARAVAVGKGRRIPLIARVRSLLGVPYLWGGRTALGFDCSGFVQQVMAEQGVSLPRDAWQQYRVGRALSSGEHSGPGDLLFFAAPRSRPSHVGIALGGAYYAHARGRVLIGSTDPDNRLCDKELLNQLRAVRRPPGPDRAGSPTRSRPIG
jgi:cell wall-associated NlpC family hydrolase